MIKIKDYIFNENDIKRIQLLRYSKHTEIRVTTNDEVCNCGIATFDDIEWNYCSNKAQISLQNQLVKLQQEKEELEEENKSLKAKVDLLNDNRHFLNNKIDKAIEYIAENKHEMYSDQVKDLLDILKGSEE